MRLLLSVLVLLFSFSSFAAQPVKDWTFLVFLNGHNNLDDFGAFNINEMEKVGSTDKINVVVQWASLQAKNTLRLYVKKDNDVNTVTSPVVQTLPTVDMGDYNSVIDFVKWAHENYPARHYFVSIWDHGGGWHLNLDGKSNIALDNISWDDNTGHFITTPQLGMAMDAAAKIIGHKVDIYGSDACLMAMPDVATQVRNSVDYYVGSEETEPGQGWPYTEILTEWNKLASATPEDVSKIMVQEYVKSYLPNGSHRESEVTFSAFNLSQDRVAPLLASIQTLGKGFAALSAAQKQKVIDVIGQSQSFAYSDYVDLGDFLTNLDNARVDQGLSPLVAQVRAAAGNYIIASAATPGYAKATGASVWLPADTGTMNSYMKDYQDLDFNKLTGWGAALQALFN